MVADIKNLKQKWGGNGEKKELGDYRENVEKWELEQNKNWII